MKRESRPGRRVGGVVVWAWVEIAASERNARVRVRDVFIVPSEVGRAGDAKVSLLPCG